MPFTEFLNHAKITQNVTVHIKLQSICFLGNGEYQKFVKEELCFSFTLS